MTRGYIVINGQPIEVYSGPYRWVYSWMRLNGVWAREAMTTDYQIKRQAG